MSSTLVLPTRTELCHLFSYNMVTGELLWRNHPRYKSYTGRIAGNYGTKGRRCHHIDVKLNGVSYKAHRLIWRLVYGDAPHEIDHIDGNPQNNRLQNLRVHPTHNHHNRVENRHLSEPIRVTINGKLRYTETGKRIMREYHRTGKWDTSV